MIREPSDVFGEHQGDDWNGKPRDKKCVVGLTRKC